MRGDTVVQVDTELWGWIWRIGARSELLTGAETNGPIGVLAACRDLGIPAQLQPTEHGPPTLTLDPTKAGSSNHYGHWAD